jgi:hypothetical protein
MPVDVIDNHLARCDGCVGEAEEQETADAQMAELLRSRGYRVVAPEPPPAEHQCLVCGRTDSENVEEYGGELVDAEVRMAVGEEGASYVTRWVCGEHLQALCEQLIALGFESHHHGSTTFLAREGTEAPCGGYGNCTLYEQFDDMGEEY